MKYVYMGGAITKREVLVHDRTPLKVTDYINYYGLEIVIPLIVALAAGWGLYELISII